MPGDARDGATNDYDRAMRLFANDEFVEAERLLRDAAEAGHPQAVAELARLLTLTPRADELDLSRPGRESAAEHWLRRAIALRPDDAVAAALLAARLDRQCYMIEYYEPWQSFADNLDDDELDDIEDLDAEEERLEQEWLADVARRRSDADRFAAMVDADDSPSVYSWYLLEESSRYNNNGDTALLALVFTDPREARWAFARKRLKARYDEEDEYFRLAIYQRNELAEVIDLASFLVAEGDQWRNEGRLDWAAVPFPALSEPTLPVGRSVRPTNPVLGDVDALSYGLTSSEW